MVWLLRLSHTVFEHETGIVAQSRKDHVPTRNRENPALSPDVERRIRVMNDLVNKWKDEIKLFRASYSINESARALARDSVNLLLCTDETVELLQFLESQKMESLKILIEKQIRLQLGGERSAELRHSLCKVKNTVYRERWAFEAGSSCPLSSFDAFASSLDESARQNAQFGRNLELVKKDAKAAFSSTLDALRGNVSSGQVQQILVSMVEALPANANFAEIEALLPADGGDGLGRIERARSQLIRRMAESDPMAAVNYVMAHADRIHPGAVGSAVESLVSKDPAGGLELVQSLPSGPHFDAAVNIASLYISLDYPTEARELASQISDPELRAEALKNVDSAQSEDHRGE